MAIAPPPPPPEIAVVPPAPAPPPEDPAIRARADAAVSDAETMLEGIAMQCEAEWLEPEKACSPAQFEAMATDYQAYYAEHANPLADNARIDSLARLGGPDASVEQVQESLVRHCEDRCRKKRFVVLEAAADEAAEKCFKTRAGDDACRAFVKKLSVNVRRGEAEHWADECFGRCEDRRQFAKAQAELERKRPKTAAESVACKAKCRRDHPPDGFCGTPLVTCFSRCTMKGDAMEWPF